jgi:2',3'-cyclic-nucleotide 2'-phosphodiesterase
MESTDQSSSPESIFTILFFGDVVGEPGRRALAERLSTLKAKYDADIVIVNGENIAGGRGITPKLAIGLMRSGVSVITTGDHIWDQREIAPYIDTEPRLLRPLNYPPGTPGHGSFLLETPKCNLAVLNLQGRTFTQPLLENPFVAADKELSVLGSQAQVVFVDFHAETTSEKIAMGHHLDGRVSAVVGTHTHVQTADEKILPGGTAFLCDAGMCGPVHSVLGRSVEAVVSRFVTSMPERFPIAKGDVELCGAVVRVDPRNGMAKSIERFRDVVRMGEGAAESDDHR